MTAQFDLFAAPAPPQAGAGGQARPAAQLAPEHDTPPHLRRAYPWPNAHLRPPRPIHPLAGVSPESIAAMAAVELLDELPPIVPGALPRVAVGRDGWNHAMRHRGILVRQQLAGTISPAESEALAALSYINLQQVDWSPAGPIIITAQGLDHLRNALAGLRCVA